MHKRGEEGVRSGQSGSYDSPALVDLGTLEELTKGGTIPGIDVCNAAEGGTLFGDSCPP